MADADAREVLNVNESVGVQAGSIVSRVVVKRETGSVTIFAFDEGQELSEHTAPFDALVHVTEGEAEVKVGGVLSRVKAGEMILMPAGVPHGLRAPMAFRMVLSMVRA